MYDSTHILIEWRHGQRQGNRLWSICLVSYSDESLSCFAICIRMLMFAMTGDVSFSRLLQTRCLSPKGIHGSVRKTYEKPSRFASCSIGVGKIGHLKYIMLSGMNVHVWVCDLLVASMLYLQLCISCFRFIRRQSGTYKLACCTITRW